MAKDRSIATDALEVMGKIIPEDKQVNRDAVHLGTIAVTCAHPVLPGTHVGFLKNGMVSSLAPKKIAIVDPFLPVGAPIMPGEKFLVIMYPRTLASLNHVWSHPDVPDDNVKIVEKIVYRDPEPEPEEDYDDGCRLCYEG